MELSPEQQKAQDQRDFYHAWGWLLGVTALGALVGLIYYLGTEQSPWFKVAAVAELVAALCWFIDAFTGDPYRKRTHAVILSYFFVVVSLLLLAVPTFGGGKAIGSEPIGILPGCVRDAEMKELSCERVPTKTAAIPAAGDAKAQAQPKGGEKASPGQPKSEKPGESQKTEAQAADQRLNNQWLINIGGVVSPQGTSASSTAPKACGKEASCPVYVSGGIAVPLYFVILALIGGAISLSRRVPEIQKRSENGYVGTQAESKLQPETVREMLAFQILQFISAPLIAVTAYQIIRPEAMASSAALAFMCGFGSETILLMIRGVANGLKPQSVTPASTGTVSGTVTDGGQPVAKIQVSVTGTALKANTDDNGSYAIREVPVGDREIVASERNRSGKAAASVQSGQTVTADIRLQRTGSVAGRVTNASGNPLKEATVAVVSQPSLKAVTDAAGKYTIERVPVGQHEIGAKHTEGQATAVGTAQAQVVFDQPAACDIVVR